MRDINDLLQIVGFGGGIEIDGSRCSTRDLTEIADAAARKGGSVVIKGAWRMSTQDLTQIASRGKGSVPFDFTE